MIDHKEGMRIPPGYRFETRVRKGLMIGGVITFSVNYIVSAAYGIGACSNAGCSARDVWRAQPGLHPSACSYRGSAKACLFSAQACKQRYLKI